MDFLGWMTLVGGLLLSMALASAFRHRLPVATSAVYLAVGILLGPLAFGLLRIDVRQGPSWLERLTEVAVILSLFVSGLKLRLPFRDPAWRAAYLLAGPVMVGSILGVAAFAHLALGLPLALATLLGAILAPTDPVLASAVAVNEASDKDRVRYALSGEAGLNDGTAFPFVMFGLLWAQHGSLGAWTGTWLVHRLLWAIPAALLLGLALGFGVGRLMIALRHRQQETVAPSDFLALALVALSYVGAERIGARGFLATFAAGLGLRRAELMVVKETPHPEVKEGPSEDHPPAEHLVPAHADQESLKEPAVAAGTLVAEAISFGETAERLLEVLLVVIVGVAVAVQWDARAIPLALVLFLVIRPVCTWLLLRTASTSRLQTALLSWFGIRGIGSVYYLAFALGHGVTGAAATSLSDLTISVIALSILLHGLSAQPVLAAYERWSGGPERCRAGGRR
jgi:sodium/hydrogen antiporter